MKTIINPRKRPLLSMDKKPNKYSNSGNGSKKRALNGRPPKLASVARLESLLDGATKKKRKSRSRVVDGDIQKGKNNQNAIRISKDGGMDRGNTNANGKRSTSSNNNTTGRRRISDENARNEACGDRWSHLNSITKSKDRKSIVNPFLEANRPQKAQKTKTDDAKIISPDLFLSKAKKDRKKKKHSIIKSKGGFRKEETIDTSSNTTPLPFLAAITPRKAIQSPVSTVKSNYDDTRYNISKELAILNSNRTNDNNDGIQNSSRLQPASSSTLEATIPNNHVEKKKPAVSDESSSLMQKPAVGEGATTSRTISEASSPKSNDRGSIALDSSFRPKLGLRLSNKNNNKITTKGNKPAASASTSSKPRFYSSLPVSSSSSPTEFLQTSTSVAAKGNEAGQEDGLLIVLGSPGKSSDSGTANNGKSFDESTPVGAQVGLGNTAWGTNSSVTNSRSKWSKPSKKKNLNDNFVRQNLKNNAGACRGAKNKSSKFSKERRTWTFRGGDTTNGDNNTANNYASQGSFTNPTLTFDAPVPPSSSSYSTNNNHDSNNNGGDDARTKRFNRYNASKSSKSNATSYVSKMSGLDPLDEFVDGTFHSSETKTGLAKTKAPTKSTAADAVSATITTTPTPAVFGETLDAQAPKCARHQRPCKKIKVRKATTGNKGREFYACSMPRGEQCDHFQWADDTVEVRIVLLSNLLGVSRAKCWVQYILYKIIFLCLHSHKIISFYLYTSILLPCMFLSILFSNRRPDALLPKILPILISLRGKLPLMSIDFERSPFQN